jgi:hypothetical protein
MNLISARAAVAALALALALAVAAIAIAGCGSTATKTVTASPSGATGSSATASSSSSQTTNATSTSSGAAAPPPCRASGLSLSFLGQQGAVGHGVIGLALRNTGSASCHTFGYPGVLWLSKAGTPLPTSSMRTTRDFFGTAPLVSLTVPPGGVVSFRLGVTHGAGGTAGCTTAAALQVIPPNDTATLRVTIPNGVFECRTTTVTPVRPGKSAFQL